MSVPLHFRISVFLFFFEIRKSDLFIWREGYNITTGLRELRVIGSDDRLRPAVLYLFLLYRGVVCSL